MTGTFGERPRASKDRPRPKVRPSEPLDHPFIEIARLDRRVGNAKISESDDQALDSFAKAFAEKFLVSPIAMRIRLEKLGLLHRTGFSGFCPMAREPLF